MQNANGLLKKLKDLNYFDVEILTPESKCDSCEKITGDVNLCIDPWINEIHGQYEWKFLCEECHKQHCYDV